MSKEKIQQLQKEIEEKRKELVQLRQEQTPEEIKNYILKTKEGKDISLLNLFGEADELLVIHNMGKECRYCTMWADGFRGFSEIISDRMPWVLTSPNSPEVLKEFSENRNWNFRVASFHNTDFGFDLGYETRKDGRKSFQPGVSSLIKKEGKIYRIAHDSFGPGDYYNAAWHFFDLFPKGDNGWIPKYDYTSS